GGAPRAVAVRALRHHLRARGPRPATRHPAAGQGGRGRAQHRLRPQLRRRRAPGAASPRGGRPGLPHRRRRHAELARAVRRAGGAPRGPAAAAEPAGPPHAGGGQRGRGHLEHALPPLGAAHHPLPRRPHGQGRPLQHPARARGAGLPAEGELARRAARHRRPARRPRRTARRGVSVAAVFFATIAAGGGHVATARALAEALGSRHPGRFTTTVSDVMAELGFEALDARHKAGWRALLKRPRLVRLGQRATDAVPRLSRAAQNAMLDGFAEEAARRLDALSPALVVANHGWLATALTRAQRRYGMRSRLVVFATEPFDASALWAEPHAEVVVAPSAAARADLVRLGVPPERVHVLGYPVREAFLRPPAREAARGELGLGDELTCLLSLGAEGVAGEAL